MHSMYSIDTLVRSIYDNHIGPICASTDSTRTRTRYPGTGIYRVYTGYLTSTILPARYGYIRDSVWYCPDIPYVGAVPWYPTYVGYCTPTYVGVHTVQYRTVPRYRPPYRVQHTVYTLVQCPYKGWGLSKVSARPSASCTSHATRRLTFPVLSPMVQLDDVSE